MIVFQYFFRILLVIVMPTAGLAQAEPKEEDREGGLTGTGIIGTVLQKNGVFINGHKVAYTDATRVQSPLGSELAEDLRQGDTIAARVELRDGIWVAREINQIFPIIAPVSQQNDNALVIMGTQVDISALPDVAVEAGEWVAVSGLWREEQIVASRVEVVAAQKTAQIVGTYFAPATSLELQIGGSEIEGVIPEYLSEGDAIRVTGQPADNGLSIQTVDVGLFSESVGVVLAQGYMSKPRQNGLYAVLGAGILSVTDQPEMIDGSIINLVCGVEGQLVTGTQQLEDEVLQRLTSLGCAP